MEEKQTANDKYPEVNSFLEASKNVIAQLMIITIYLGFALLIVILVTSACSRDINEVLNWIFRIPPPKPK